MNKTLLAFLLLSPLNAQEAPAPGPRSITANNISTPVFGEAGGRVSLEALVEVTFELTEGSL